MKISNSNLIREKYSKMFLDFLSANEDVMRTGSGSVAFPIVAEDGEEGWVEVVVKVPKWDETDDGYSRATEYSVKVADKQAKAVAREEERKRKEEERKRKAAEKEAKKAEEEGE